jgi:hypothetical protein
MGGKAEFGNGDRERAETRNTETLSAVVDRTDAGLNRCPLKAWVSGGRSDAPGREPPRRR